MTPHGLYRRLLLKRALTLSMLAAIERLIPACAVTPTTSVSPGSPTSLSADVIDLIISGQRFVYDGHTATAMTFNGSIPGPVVRLKEGQQATLRVRNRLEESTSIHWHGILLPHDMDGVPGVSFADIKPGTTYTYRFPSNRAGRIGFIVIRVARRCWGSMQRSSLIPSHRTRFGMSGSSTCISFGKSHEGARMQSPHHWLRISVFAY